MPIQKGKKRKRIRRRGPSTTGASQAEASSRGRQPVPPPTVAKRRGWQPPLWVNLAFGLGMLVVGVVFTIVPQKGMSTQNRLLLLVAYCVIAGFYLARAFRQYRARQQSEQ
ncbi:MAG: hypothetical protein LC772_13075 [Chloroflexi bacterium]|nr:hypothetical protein [Chloroflexota bacterium]